MRRTGLAPGTEDERDLGQVRLAIEAVRALLPLIEQSAPDQVGPIRDALSQLQLAFVRIGGRRPPTPAPSAGARRATAGLATRRGRTALPRTRPRAAPEPEPPTRHEPGEPARPSAAGDCGCPASSRRPGRHDCVDVRASAR